jgi:large subunit ribosomal protein L3
MKFILGTKQHMTQYFGEDGKVFPATVVTAGPVVITQVKTTSADGYTAVQVGFSTQKNDRLNKALRGHLKGNAFKHIKEFRIGDTASYEVGSEILPTIFSKGDKVTVSGTSKGKGFQGVVKRHGFAGGPRSHGQKHSEREPGSIGGGLRNRVPKGMRMAGRMGSDRITVKNLEILHIDEASNTLYVKGAIPGRRGTLLEIVAK